MNRERIAEARRSVQSVLDDHATQSGLSILSSTGRRALQAACDVLLLELQAPPTDGPGHSCELLGASLSVAQARVRHLERKIAKLAESLKEIP